MYTETEKKLAATYLFDQGEKDLNVFRNLFWQEPDLTMDEVARRVTNIRLTKEYQDFYAPFAGTYDKTFNRNPTDYAKNEKFKDDYTINRFFFIASERKLSPQTILNCISINDLYRSAYYQNHFGRQLILLGENAQLKPWERLVADTVYYHFSNNLEIEKSRMAHLQQSGAETDASARISQAEQVNRAREELYDISHNYQVSFNAFPPLPDAVSQIYGLANYEINEDIVTDTILKYKDDQFDVSAIADHLRKQEKKEEENRQNYPSAQFTGLITPSIAAALLATAHFQSIIGTKFEHLFPFSVDKTTIGVSDAYLQHIDREIDELEKSIAIQELNPEHFKDTLASNKARLPELRDISRVGHQVIAEINNNLTLRSTIEQQAANGLLAATDVRIDARDRKNVPLDIQSNYFQNVYGYQLENLAGRKLSQGDLFAIFRYREFLAARVDNAEAKLKVMETAPINKNELRELWKAYATDSKLLNVINERLQHYSAEQPKNNHAEIVQLIYHPLSHDFSMQPALRIGIPPLLTIDPFITAAHAQAFINDVSQKLATHTTDKPISHLSMISEFKFWEQMNAQQDESAKQLYLSTEIQDNSNYTLPANLRQDMILFHEIEKQWEKYVADIQYDIAHPEFIGIWQVDQNYRDKDNLMKKDIVPQPERSPAAEQEKARSRTKQ